VGAGALFALAPGKGILAHREAEGVLHTYVALNKPQEWISDFDFIDAAAVDGVAAEFEGWAPGLTALANTGPLDQADGNDWSLPVGGPFLRTIEVAGVNTTAVSWPAVPRAPRWGWPQDTAGLLPAKARIAVVNRGIPGNRIRLDAPRGRRRGAGRGWRGSTRTCPARAPSRTR
jgi:hypothetical protein